MSDIVFSSGKVSMPVGVRQMRITPGLNVLIALLALLLWAVSLPAVEPRAMNDLGLVSVLPPTIFIALGILTASFCIALRRESLSERLLLLHVVLLMFMLYGITALVMEVPRFATTWKLVGIADYIMNTGTVDPQIDAFFNWPGFFILNAFVTSVAGLDSPLQFAAWSHFFFNLLYLGPLLLIHGSGTSDRRLVWLGSWFFFATNWIGQDYLAPQAFNYFLFLVVLGLLLTWFKTQRPPLTGTDEGWRQWGWSRIQALWAAWRRPPQTYVTPSTGYQRGGMMYIIVLFLLVMAASHQLTPFATLAVVMGLVLLGRVSVRGLPLLILVITGTWISFMTVSYLSGHFDHVTAPLGAVGQNLNANVTGRFSGSQEHLFVLRMRLVMSLVLWSLALLGGLRRLRGRHVDLSLAVLAAMPFGLLALQAYGGELLLRVYLFALPGMSFFAAVLFLPSATSFRSARTVRIIGVVSLLLLLGFQVTRYGNERVDYFTEDEVDAVRVLYETVEPPARIVALTDALPWRFEHYRSYRYIVADRNLRRWDIEGLAEMMADPSLPPAYLIFTRTQKASAELFFGMDPGSGEAYERAMLETGYFEVIYANDDAKIFAIREGLVFERESDPDS